MTPNILPDIESLRCFVAAAELLRFRAAARRVGLSPAAFSERLRRLEDDLGERLFERTTRRVALTAAGSRLLPHARDVLSSAGRCAQVARGDGRPLPFELTLGSRYELALSWLCPALTPLRQERPERTLHLYLADANDLMGRVETGDIDAAIHSARVAQVGLDSRVLHEERYAFVGTDQMLETVDQAGDYALIDVNPELPLFRYMLDALDETEPWGFARHEYMGGIGAIRQRVLKGVGVAVLPEYFVREDIAEGRMKRLLPDIELRTDAFRMFWQERHARRDELVHLAQQLRTFPLR